MMRFWVVLAVGLVVVGTASAVQVLRHRDLRQNSLALLPKIEFHAHLSGMLFDSA